jgi:hypothetical protein
MTGSTEAGPTVLRYARDVGASLQLVPDGEALASLSGLVSKIRSSGRIRFIQLRDVTGSIQLVAEKETLGEASWASVTSMRAGARVSVEGHVGRTRMGEASVFLTRPPILRSEDLGRPIAGSESQYANVGMQIFLARLRNRATDFYRASGLVEIEPKFISSAWETPGLEPIQLLYPGFGSTSACLAPSPSVQLLDAMLVTGTPAVFAASRCFSTTFRDERSSTESLIVAAKFIEATSAQLQQSILDAVEFVLSELETLPEAGFHPRESWKTTQISGPSPRRRDRDVDIPTFEVYRTPDIGRGSESVRLAEIYRLLWPARSVIAEGALEQLDAGVYLGSSTLHIERMASLLRDVPVRRIRNLGLGEEN